MNPSNPATQATPRAARRRIASCIATVIVPIAVTWMIAGCAVAPPALPSTIARDDIDAVGRALRELIDDQLRSQSIGAISVAIVDDQRIAWAGGGGWADRDAGRRADEHTIYRMGSITKLVTTTAMLQLVGERRIGLDDPITTALPDFSVRSRFDARPITVRDLLTHHSGLPRDEPLGMWARHPQRFTRVVQQLGDRDADHPPGRIGSYSNVAFDVLGAAIERLTGKPYEQVIRERVFEPIGMTSASIGTGIADDPRAAHPSRDGRRVDEPLLRDLPAGGLDASVVDMSRFMMMVFAGGRRGDRVIVDPAWLSESLRPQNAAVALDVGFHHGLGWMLSMLDDEQPVGAGPLAHHGGATIHFRSQLLLLPAQRLGVIVAANSASATSAVDMIARRALVLALEATRGISRPPPPATVADASSLPAATLDTYAGDYATQAGYLRIVHDQGRLKANLGGRTLDLVEGGDGRFGLRYALLGLVDIPLGSLGRIRVRRERIAGRDLLIGRLGEQDLLLGERLPAPVPFDDGGLAGTWVPIVDEGETQPIERVRLFKENGRWLAEVRLSDDMGTMVEPIVPLSEPGTAILAGPLADSGPTVRRVVADGDTQLLWAGMRLRRR